ncbi:MAG: ATP-binding protein [Desulfobacteraceae bacterium]|jgi:two-component system sensor histidine kinase PilS (NtrC family)|nr:ATP-binding protein [Desulfobacteraceae bacterium]
MPEKDFKDKLKWLMLFRVLFSTLLLGSSIVLQLGDSPPPIGPPLKFLYGLIATIFFLSIIYALAIDRIKKLIAFAYAQILVDILVVTVILFATGSFSSIFSFLYLVVIIYSSILLSIRGTLVIAAICSIQFGILVDFEYYGIIYPFAAEAAMLASTHPWNQVLYKILITMTACFAVAFLSSFLSEQVRSTRKELLVMENHVKRVEKMAAVGEMAAGLAHEIKNPLASLTGSIQLLKEDIQYDPDHDRLMQIILREADRLSSLANNFLLYARPPAGKVEAIELEKVIIETAELFEKDASNDGRITTTKKLQSNIWISMDPVHLRQILWNLLLNASEAIEGEGVIDIEMYELKSKRACIKITDNGCGMSPEELKSIFDPFFTTKPTGTGLGLSIVHRILEAYGFWMNVESEAGNGTTLTLHFKQIESPSPTL